MPTNTDLERSFYGAKLGLTDTQIAQRSLSDLRAEFVFRGSGPNPPAASMGARLGKGTAEQSVASGAETKVTFNDTLFDAGGFIAPRPNALTVPSNGAGLYSINAATTFNNPASAVGIRAIIVKKNGTVFLADVPAFGLPISSAFQATTTDLFANLVAGDYLEVSVFQTQGAAIGVVGLANARNIYTTFGMARVGV